MSGREMEMVIKYMEGGKGYYDDEHDHYNLCLAIFFVVKCR